MCFVTLEEYTRIELGSIHTGILDVSVLKLEHDASLSAADGKNTLISNISG